MGNLKCKKCGWQPGNESNVDLHHIVPKMLGGTDKDGRFYLCRAELGNDCHRKFHIYLRENQELKDLLKKITKEWLEKKDDRNTETIEGEGV